MTHTRIRKFNTRETYPEQNLDNDLCQAVIEKTVSIMVATVNNESSIAAISNSLHQNKHLAIYYLLLRLSSVL